MQKVLSFSVYLPIFLYDSDCQYIPYCSRNPLLAPSGRAAGGSEHVWNTARRQRNILLSHVKPPNGHEAAECPFFLHIPSFTTALVSLQGRLVRALVTDWGLPVILPQTSCCLRCGCRVSVLPPKWRSCAPIVLKCHRCRPGVRHLPSAG